MKRSDCVPKRLLVICHGYPPFLGGGELATESLARHLQGSGVWKVTVLTGDIGGRLVCRETRDDIEIIRVPTRKAAWTRHTWLELLTFAVSSLRACGAVVREVRPDHVIAAFSFPAGSTAAWIRRRFGIPYTVVLHGSDVPGYQNARFGYVYPFYAPLVRAVWRRACHVVAVSRPLSQLAAKVWPAGQFTVIPNGVDTALFRPAQGRISGMDVPLRIVLVSQLIERKGIPYLLKALSALDAALRSRLLLEIYGTGPMEQELRRTVAASGLTQQVRIIGAIDRDALPGILSNADMFVLPSLQEGCPLVILEAMASGLPVIATRVGGIPDLVQDGVNGILVPPADAEALCRAVASLASSAQMRTQLGVSARASAEQHSWARICEQFGRLILNH